MEKNFKVIQINLPKFQSFQSRKAEEFNTLIISLKNPKTLELQNHFFGQEGMQILSRGLSKCETLEKLDLSNNLISEEVFSCFSAALFRMKSLRNLNLSNNLLGPLGIKKLSVNLSQFSSLIFLDLSSNNIKPEGAVFLSEKISSLISLKGLVLSNNKLGDIGSLQIVSSLNQRLDINYICLRNNLVTSTGMRNLISKLKIFKNLRLLHVEKDPCKEMKLVFMLNTVGMKGIQGDVGGLKMCKECNRHCEPALCEWSRTRGLCLTRLFRTKLI